jgi:hypothetical protein
MMSLNIKAVLPEKDEFDKTITRIDIQAINSKINNQDLTIGFCLYWAHHERQRHKNGV